MNQKITCTNCGENIQAGVRICPSCSQHLSGAVESVQAESLKVTDRKMAIRVAIAFGLLTILDSLFWLTYVDVFADPSSPNRLLQFRDFAEWSLPTAAMVLLIMFSRGRPESWLTVAVALGGFAPLLVDLLINGGYLQNTTITSLLGLWEVHDWLDFTASCLLITYFGLYRRQRKTDVESQSTS